MSLQKIALCSMLWTAAVALVLTSLLLQGKALHLAALGLLLGQSAVCLTGWILLEKERVRMEDLVRLAASAMNEDGKLPRLH